MGLINLVKTFLNLLKKSEVTQEQLEKAAGISNPATGDMMKVYDLRKQNQDLQNYQNFINGLSELELQLLLETYYVGTNAVSSFDHTQHSKDQCLHKFISLSYDATNHGLNEGIKKIEHDSNFFSGKQYL